MLGLQLRLALNLELIETKQVLRDGQLSRPGVTTLTLTPKAITDQDPVKYGPKCEVVDVTLCIATANVFFLVALDTLDLVQSDRRGLSSPFFRACCASFAWTGQMNTDRIGQEDPQTG